MQKMISKIFKKFSPLSKEAIYFEDIFKELPDHPWFKTEPLRELRDGMVAHSLHNNGVDVKYLNAAFMWQNNKYISLLYKAKKIDEKLLFKTLKLCYSTETSHVLRNLDEYIDYVVGPHRLSPFFNPWHCVKYEILPLDIESDNVIVLSGRCLSKIIEDDTNKTVADVTLELIKKVAKIEELDADFKKLQYITPKNLKFLICPQVLLFELIKRYCNDKSRFECLTLYPSYTDLPFEQ